MVGPEADPAVVFPQDPVAQGVNGGYPDPVHIPSVTHGMGRDRKPLSHLGGGQAPEGQQHRLFGSADVVEQKVDQAPGEDAGLAGSGAGPDQQRPLQMADHRKLLLVQAGVGAVYVG